MKKWIAMLLTLCLLLPFAGALAVVVTTTSSDSISVGGDEESTSVASLATLDGTAYALYTDGRLTAMAPATRTQTPLGKLLYSAYYTNEAELSAAQAAQEEALVPVDMLFVDGGILYGLCTVTGQTYTLLDTLGAFAPTPGVKLDVSALRMADGEGRLTVVDIAAAGGKLFAVTRDDMTSSLTTTLVGLDLAGGQAKTYNVQNVQDVEAYADGKLLLRRYDLNAVYTASSGGASMPGSDYGTFDIASETYTQLGEFAGEGALGAYSVSGMVYAADTGSLFFIDGGRIEGIDMATGETRTSAYTGEGMLGGYGMQSSSGYAQGGYYLRGNASGLTVLALDTDAVKQGALRIFGEFGTDAHKSFSQNYPDIPVDVASDYTASLETITNAMISENNAYDVLLMIMSYMPVERLIQKGYCEDLSAYPEIMERVAKLDPRFLEEMTVDGKLYGVPVSSTAFTYGVNMAQWEALGLTKDDLPTSLIAFYDFLANYMVDYGEDHPDVNLFDMGGEQIKLLLFSLMLDQYITYGQAKLDNQAAFDTPLVREVLTAFEQIDFEELIQELDMTSVSYMNRDALFSAYLPVTTFSSYYKDITPLILPLTDEAEPVIGANLSVLVLNPKSQRKADAVKYICNYLDNLDDSSAIVLNASDNEPRIVKDYDKNHASLLEQIAKKQTLLDAAEESRKASIREEITQLEASLAQLEENKYSVSAEQIQVFREQISDKLAVCQQSVIYSADEAAQSEMSSLMMQYLSGAVTQEQLLKEMDKRTRMMALENQ